MQAIILSLVALAILYAVGRDLVTLTREVFKVVIFVLFTFTAAYSQSGCETLENGVFKRSVNKQGMVSASQCLWVNVCENIVEFRVSNTAVQTFVRRGSEWASFGTLKLVERSEKDGMVIFTLGKNDFIYTLKK